MKRAILFSLLALSCVSFADATKATRKPSQATPDIQVEGPAAENLLHAILGANENVPDLCATHSCHLIVDCSMHREGEDSGSNHHCTIKRAQD